MNHFEGINAQERYNNDLLNEMRKLNENINKLLERHVQAVEPTVIKAVKPTGQIKPAQRQRRKKVVNK